MVKPAFPKEHTPSLFSHTFPEREAAVHADRLVADHAYLCRRGARKFSRAGVECCDLEQVAAIGLIKASRRFEPAATTPFEAYAWLIIVGELMHYVRDHERLVRVPRRLRNLESQMNVARDIILARCGREPHDSELAEEMGIDRRIVTDVRSASAAAAVVSLEDLHTRPHTIAGDLDLDDRLLVTDAFARLTLLERRVVVGIHVLGITQLELSRILGVSARRISRVRRGAVEAMQQAWAS